MGRPRQDPTARKARLELESLEERTLLSWAQAVSLPTARLQLAAATGTDGRIYALGGSNATGTATNTAGTTVEAYTPSVNSWATLAPMPTARTLFGAATGTDGRIYAVGGQGIGGAGALDTMEIYTPSSNTWKTGPNAPFSGAPAASAGKDGRIYEFQEDASMVVHVGIYNPTTNGWIIGATVTINFTGPDWAATGGDGRIYLFGGTTTSGTSTVGTNEVIVYNPTTNTWSTAANMPVQRTSVAAATGTDGRIYVIGGQSDTSMPPDSTVYVYDPKTNGWTTVDNLPTGGRYELAAAGGTDGRIYAIGGSTQMPAVPIAEVDVFTPPTTAPPPPPGGTGGTGGSGGQPGVPTGSMAGANRIFVQALYRDLLGRPADPFGLSLFTGDLNAGSASRTQVVQQIISSSEFATVEVTALYSQFLKRQPEPNGLQIGVNFLQHRGTDEALQAIILGSDEYFANRGSGTNAGFLTALYQDVLSQAIATTTEQTLQQELASGTSRTTIAAELLATTASDTLEAQALYHRILMRDADPGGLSSVVSLLQQGVPNEQVEAILAESLEYTQKNGGDPNAIYVSQLYHDLLNRSPDAAGLAQFTNQLDAGATRTQVVQQIVSSTEFLTLEAGSLYNQYLRRQPDAFGLQASVNLLQQGVGSEQLAAVLLGSTEYFDGPGGGTNAGFLSAVYKDVLNRPIDAFGMQVWEQALAGSTSRMAVAAAILGSLESDKIEAENLYRSLLRRNADSGGLNATVGQLQQGVPNEEIIVELAASQEYFARSGS